MGWVEFAYCTVLFLSFLFFLHRFLFLLSFLCFSFFPFFFSFACISSLFSFFSYLCLSSLSPTLVPFLSDALSPSFSSFISLVSLAPLFSFFSCLHHFLPSPFFYFPFLSISFVSPLPFLLLLCVLIFLFCHFSAHPRIFFQVRREIFHIRKSIWSVSEIKGQVCLLIHWYQYIFSEQNKIVYKLKNKPPTTCLHMNIVIVLMSAIQPVHKYPSNILPHPVQVQSEKELS